MVLPIILMKLTELIRIHIFSLNQEEETILKISFKILMMVLLLVTTQHTVVLQAGLIQVLQLVIYRVLQMPISILC